MKRELSIPGDLLSDFVIEVEAKDVDPEVHFSNGHYYIKVGNMPIELKEWCFDYWDKGLTHKFPKRFKKLDKAMIELIVEAMNRKSEVMTAFVDASEKEPYCMPWENTFSLFCLWQEGRWGRKKLVDVQLLETNVELTAGFVWTPYDERLYDNVLKFFVRDGKSLGCATFLSLEELPPEKLLIDAYKMGVIVPQMDYDGRNWTGFRLSSYGHSLVLYVLRSEEVERRMVKKYSRILRLYLSTESVEKGKDYTLSDDFLCRIVNEKLIKECVDDLYLYKTEVDGWALTWLGYSVLNRHEEELREEERLFKERLKKLE